MALAHTMDDDPAVAGLPDSRHRDLALAGCGEGIQIGLRALHAFKEGAALRMAPLHTTLVRLADLSVSNMEHPCEFVW